MSTAIALPRWCAVFTAPGRAPDPPPPSTHGDAVTTGPFTIVCPEAACERTVFGNPADPTVLLFEGYMLERRRLGAELGLDHDATQAAVAAAAFERWGLEVFDRIDGSYLMAIWDPREQRLLLGHDPLGHHPVFYAEQAGTLWFSSNVLALPRSGAVPSTPNRVSLALAALRLWPASGETFFEHVRRLRPGSYLSVSSDQVVRTTAYWSPWLEDDEPGLTEAQAREQFEPMLVDAIGRCMELGPQGIMLSGGLDSVTIAALAADYSRGHGTPLVRAVSGRRNLPDGVAGPLSDEEPMQDAVARALHMEHLVAREAEWTGPRPSVELSLDAVRDLPGPSRIYWVGAYMAFYRFVAARGVQVALTGSGGDNWVGVGDAFAAEAMRNLRLGDLVQHVRSWTGTGGLTFRQAAHHLLWSGGLRLLLDSWSARLVPGLKASYHRDRASSSMPDWLCPDPHLREALIESQVGGRPAALTPEGRVPRNFYRHAQRSTRNPYFQYEFEVGFHVESTCGLRLLSPYHDRSVVRFLNSIPPRVLLEGASYKGMLRPVAQKRLPGLGLEKQRKVYSPRVISSHLDELRDGTAMLWRATSLDRLARLGVVDARAAKEAFVPSAQSGFDVLVPVYALLSAERWLRVHAPSA